MEGPHAAPTMPVHLKKLSASSYEGDREHEAGPARKITVKVLTEAARNADRLRQEIAAIKLSVAAGVGGPSGPQQLMRSRSMEKSKSMEKSPLLVTQAGTTSLDPDATDNGEARRRSSLERSTAFKIGGEEKGTDGLGEDRRRSSLERSSAFKMGGGVQPTDEIGEARRRSSLERSDAFKIGGERKRTDSAVSQQRKQVTSGETRAKTPLKTQPIVDGTVPANVGKKAAAAGKRSGAKVGPLPVDSPDWLDKEMITGPHAKAKPVSDPSKSGGSSEHGDVPPGTVQPAKPLDFSLTAMRKHLNSTQAHGPGDMSRSTEEMKKQMLEKLRAVNSSFKENQGAKKSKFAAKARPVEANRAAAGGADTAAEVGEETRGTDIVEGKTTQSGLEGATRLPRTVTMGKGTAVAQRTASPLKRTVSRAAKEVSEGGGGQPTGAESAPETPLEKAERLRNEAAEVISRRVSEHKVAVADGHTAPAEGHKAPAEGHKGPAAEHKAPASGQDGSASTRELSPKRGQRSPKRTSATTKTSAEAPNRTAVVQASTEGPDRTGDKQAFAEARTKEVPSGLPAQRSSQAEGEPGSLPNVVTVSAERRESVTARRSSDGKGPGSRRQSVSSSDKKPEFIDRAKKTAVKEALEKKAENLRKFREQKEAQAAMLQKQKEDHERKHLEKLGQLPPAAVPPTESAHVPEQNPANPAKTSQPTPNKEPTQRQLSPLKARAAPNPTSKKRATSVAAVSESAGAESAAESSAISRAAEGPPASVSDAPLKSTALRTTFSLKKGAVAKTGGAHEGATRQDPEGVTSARDPSKAVKPTLTLGPGWETAQKHAGKVEEPPEEKAAIGAPDLEGATSAGDLFKNSKSALKLGPGWETAQKRAGKIEEPPEEKAAVGAPILELSEAVGASSPGHSDAAGRLFVQASPKDPPGKAESGPEPEREDSQSSTAAAEKEFPTKRDGAPRENGDGEVKDPVIKQLHDNPAFSPANSPMAKASKAAPSLKPDVSPEPAPVNANPIPESSEMDPGWPLRPHWTPASAPGTNPPGLTELTGKLRHASTEEIFVSAGHAVAAAEKKLNESPVVGSPTAPSDEKEPVVVEPVAVPTGPARVPSVNVHKGKAKTSSKSSDGDPPAADAHMTVAKAERVDSRPAGTRDGPERSAGTDGKKPAAGKQISFSKSVSRGLSTKTPPISQAPVAPQEGETAKPLKPEMVPSAAAARTEPTIEKTASGLKPLKIPNNRKSVTGTLPGSPGAPAPSAPVLVVPVDGTERRKSGEKRTEEPETKNLAESQRKMQEELDLIAAGLAYVKVNRYGSSAPPEAPATSVPAPEPKKSPAKGVDHRTAPVVEQAQIDGQTVAVRRRSSAAELERERALRERLEALSQGTPLRKLNRRSKGDKVRTYWVEKDGPNKVLLCWKSGVLVKTVKSVELAAAPTVVTPASGGPVLISLQTSSGRDLTLEAPIDRDQFKLWTEGLGGIVEDSSTKS
ncbi:hypothetical protein KFL_001890190 [Klebsormidium nitens]|uniref:PH domain-containing protein n=1 Tax=Klebsormidium nitens TaxID=105231 RepID=A0A1Y1I0L5_KLENI|nr:hypothetical protein KFL_001890190 [Klebsormidium nitens]|eukprot:GAQ84455.1 hypothetical protein KFL_001890190 [Klebsormidium nitens]